MKPLSVIVAALAAAAVLLLAARPDMNNGTPDDTVDTTTTITAPITLTLPEPFTVADVDTSAARGLAIQLTEPPAAPSTTVALPPHYDIWLRLAQCESGGNWAINTGNGYYGGLQFALTSWRAVGGSGYPHQATPLEQMWAGERLLQIQGWGAWPACSRRLGLRP